MIRFVRSLRLFSLKSELVVIATLIALAVLVTPHVAFAQNVDPNTILTNILNWFTGPFGKTVIGLATAVTGIICIMGHHPLAALGVVVLGSFLVFGSSFLVNQFVGG